MNDTLTQKDLAAALPDVRSTMTFDGLDSPVEVYRDPWGIPHIRAENSADMFFAQGFATAQDRMFHMDYDRMRCLGRWSEYAGARGLESDRLMRRRGFERASKADYDVCSSEARTMLDAYSAGGLQLPKRLDDFRKVTSMTVLRFTFSQKHHISPSGILYHTPTSVRHH